jgi:hypothetical protein
LVAAIDLCTMYRAQVVANHLCADRQIERSQQLHRQARANIKTSIDTNGPTSRRKVNLKKKQMDEGAASSWQPLRAR